MEMGLRRKIFFGFLTLAMLLLFSGMVSYFELNRVSRTTQNILEASTQNIELSKKMLDVIQSENSSLLQMIVLNRADYDLVFTQSKSEFNELLNQMFKIDENDKDLEQITSARRGYEKVIEEYLNTSINTDIEWFAKMYKSSYLSLTDAVKEYMLTSQHSLSNQAGQLKGSAYRVIAPSILTLSVAFLIVIIFAFLMDIYYVRPVLKIQKGLRNYVTHNIPFNVEIEREDELADIKTDIKKVIESSRIR